MITEDNIELIRSYELSFSEILDILKVLGNEKRLRILLLLLEGSKAYSTIVDEINLKKTAISNHLSHLLNVRLIQREEYGTYSITEDGIEFLKGVEEAFQSSPSRQIGRFNKIESRQVSKSFLNRFIN